MITMIIIQIVLFICGCRGLRWLSGRLEWCKLIFSIERLSRALTLTVSVVRGRVGRLLCG